MLAQLGSVIAKSISTARTSIAKSEVAEQIDPGMIPVPSEQPNK